MNKFLFIFFIIISNSIIAQIIPDINSQEKIAKGERDFYKRKLFSEKSLAGLNYDMKYQRFNWEVDPQINFIKGSVCTYFKPIFTNLHEMSFDMSASLICDSAVYHGLHLSVNHTGEELTVVLPTPVLLGNRDSIIIFYHGVPPSNGMGSFTQATHGSGLDTYPIIWTLSEPYGAKDWMPCKQSLTDKIDSIDVFIKCPSQYRAASNGIIISEQIIGTKKYVHWKHRHPIATYLIALAVTNYARFSDWVHYPNGDSLEILNYIYPEEYTNYQQNSQLTGSFIELYNQLFVPYPYNDEKYGHAQCGFSGGMEHQTMTFLGYFEFGLVAHELSHQWFGDYITCGSWHDIWINESFATYSTGLAYERLINGNYWPVWKKNIISHATSQPDGSVYCEDTTSVDRVFDSRLSYSKGSILLHMLRWELGDSAFFTALRNYLTDPALINKFAYTQDVKHHFEAAGDTSLTEFFNDWFYGEGFPSYQINWNQNINGLATLEIIQTQSHPSVSFFEMDIPIYFYGNNIDTTYKIHNTVSPQIVTIPINFNIDSIQFDPDRWILTKNPVIHYVEIITDIEELEISPNPGNNIINLRTKNNLFIEKIEMTNMLGNSVFISKQTGDKKSFVLNTITFPAGTYILKVSTNKSEITSKIVVL